MNDLQEAPQHGVPAISFTHEQIELIKRTVAKGTTDDELALFLYAAKRSGLDPLAKQIHCVKRGDQIAIQTAIDGYRLIADRTGKYAGNDDPLFDDEDKPRKATVTVYKVVGGVRCGFTATARWDQYYPGEKQGWMWSKMPHLMLGKCAEALALRKAFPAELSGLYTDDEMQQANTINTTAEKPPIKSPEAKAPEAKPDVKSDIGGEVTFVPKVAGVKEDKNGKPRYSVKLPNGEFAGTYNEEFGQIILGAKERGEKIRLTYAIQGSFVNVSAVELA